jgi:hypothetical protein
MTIDSEPAFTAGEAAYGARDWEKAITNFDKASRGSTKAWVKNWSNSRLIELGQKTGRFDLAVRSYVQLAQDAPASAVKIRLAMPKADSAYLPEAVTTVETTLGRTAANLPAQEALARLLVDLQTARGDAKATEAATGRLADIVLRANPDSPQALAMAVKLKLAKVQTDLEAGRFDEVIARIRTEAPNIHDTADQVAMLYALAEAQRGKAAAGGGATKRDQWKEIALGYMRVVANAPADSPRVADALLRVAEIDVARLDDKAGAIAILKRMLDDYKGGDGARRAQGMLDGLK